MKNILALLALAALSLGCGRGTSVPAAPAVSPVLRSQPTAAQHQTVQDTAHHLFATPDRIQWRAGPASLPPGARMTVIHGDPTREGLFTMRLAMPDGYRIQPHFHGASENVTVISGTFAMGIGDRFDDSGLTPLPAGGFARMAPGTRHYAMARGETVVQINSIGPWVITYVTPSDDPRGRTP